MNQAKKDKILEVLKANKDRQMTTKDIQAAVGSVSLSHYDVRCAADCLLMEGHPIMAKPSGLTYTEDKDRLMHYLELLTARRDEMQKQIVMLQNIIKGGNSESE